MEWKNYILQLKQTGLKNKDIARKLEVSPSAVTEWLSGRNKQPRANTAIKLLALVAKSQISSSCLTDEDKQI